MALLGFGTSLALFLACGYLLYDRLRAPRDLVPGFADPEVREETVRQLVEASKGVWDSYPDPDVARVLQPDLSNRTFSGQPITSNAFGLRERRYELPKPEGVVRIVLLGDSIVFGTGAAAEDRVGVFLERYLQERVADREVTFECLHIGIASWNLISECAYLRRQLSLLLPDLVFQIVVANDLDDTRGVRGFGSMASFSDQQRDHADGVLHNLHARIELEAGGSNWLIAGLDYESKQRYAEAAQAIDGLSRALAPIGAPHWIVHHTSGRSHVFRTQLYESLESASVLYLPGWFTHDAQYHVSATDAHWNRAGGEWVAKMLYGVIRSRGVLPELQLEPWPEAEGLAARASKEGEDESLETSWKRLENAENRIGASIDFDDLSPATSAQIHGGIDSEGRLAPYASLILRNDAGRVLRVEGVCLDRPELDGGSVEIFVDEHPLGEIDLEAGAEIRWESALPTELLEREYLSIRFRATDYAYVGPRLRKCVAFRLERVLVSE